MYLLSLVLLLAVFAALCIQLVKKVGRLAILLLYPVIMIVQYIANLVTLDSGVFVYELGITTSNAYSAQVYVLFLVVFLLFLTLFCPKQSKLSIHPFTMEKRESIVQRYSCFFLIVIVISLCFTAYVLLDMVVSGIPLLSGGVITHYNFFKDYSRLPLAGSASNLMTFCAALLGVYYALNDRRRAKIIALVVTTLMLACRVLLGFKMTGLIDVAIAFLVGVVLFGADASKLKTKSALRIILILAVLAVAFVGLYLNYMIISGEAASLTQALDLLSERVFGMGAHLWWAALADQSSGFGLFPRSDIEMLSPFMLMDEFDTSLGVYGMMLQYGNPIVVTADVAGGVRYTADFVTTAIYYNGYILGGVVIISVAGLVAAFLRLFDKLVYDGRVASFFVAYYLFIPFTTYFCATGTLTTFFNVKTYFVLLVLGYMSMLNAWGGARSRSARGVVGEASKVCPKHDKGVLS